MAKKRRKGKLAYAYWFRGINPIFVRIFRIADALQIADQQLAKRAGVSKKTLHRWRTGATTNPQFNLVASVVIALDQGDMTIIEQRQRELKLVASR